MPKFIVQQPLKHDGENLAIGDAVELSLKDAKPLQDAGVLGAKATGKDAGADGGAGSGDTTK